MDSRSMATHKAGPNSWLAEMAFLRYPYELPQAMPKDSRLLGSNDRRNASNLSIPYFTHGYALSQYPEVIYFQMDSQQTLPMDKYERRRLKLAELRDSPSCKGVAACIARKIGREPSYVTRMLYPEGKAGKKRISDDMMEIIEDAFELPRGWMDGLTFKPLGNQQEWDKIVWLWEHADAEVKLMLSLLTGVMYEKKRRAFERKQRDESNAGAGKNNIGGLHDERGKKRTDEIQTDDN